jgi:hypothetical protein
MKRFSIFNVMIMSIGLDFVKDVDKNWKKHIQSLDRSIDEIKTEKADIFLDNKENIPLKNDEKKDQDFDFWGYWKKRYSIMK